MIRVRQYKRVLNWQSRLNAYLAKVQNLPFEWGQNDCATFVANAIKAMTGEDPMEGFRGYKTEKEAKALIKARGYRNHVDFVRKHFKKVPQALAGPGDIAVMRGDILGLVQGEYIYHPGIEQGTGLVLTSRDDVKAFYKVEF